MAHKATASAAVGRKTRSTKAAISSGNANSAAVGGWLTALVAIKSPVANQSPQYYVKAVLNSAHSATWDLYEGFMEKGKEHGLGRYTWADSECLLGTWDQGSCEEKDSREAERKEFRQRTRQGTQEKQAKEAESRKNAPGTKKKDSACKGQCVFCTNPTSTDNFECLHCFTSWCSKCEKQWKWAGYRNRRPPCHCIIARDGLATKSWDQAVQKCVIDRVESHCFKRRSGIATVNDTIFMVRCNNSQAAFLCDIGRLKGEDRTHLIEQETVRSYIKNYKPQPGVFMQLEKSWTLPPETFPVAMNSKHFGRSWNPDMFTMTRVDVDSLTINNFKVTPESIRERLTRIIGRAQIDVGTAWTSVKPPKNYHIVCSPRPVVMVYCEESQGNEMKQYFAEQLGASTFSTFIPSQDSQNVFSQAAASVDVVTLFTVWLKVVRKFRSEQGGISPMELLRIVFHGWKSDPDFIIDPFDEVGIYHKCKQDCAEFSASYDLAHKYVSNAHTDILGMAKGDSNGISKVKIPIFGPEHTIPGFTANSKSVWSMFGPLAGEKPVGSMKLDRTDPQDATSLPINVKRIKIYPSVVNLMKNIMRLSGVDVRGLTHKRLKYQGKKVAEFLTELVLNWKKHAQVLMSFRIECTIELTDAKCSLRELIAQHKKCQEQLLKGLSANTTMSLIAISDVDSLARWCLKKFMRLSTGDDKKKFHDEQMATDMLLSLWHTIGYHHLAHTRQMHARFLIELDMQKVDMNTSENQPTKLLKAVLPAGDFEWSDNTKTTMLQALRFMKVQKVSTKQKPDTFVFRYMYKKICTATTNGHQCPWCYSSKKLVKKLEDRQETTQTTMTACRSNNFETPIELALDVQARLQHHMQSCNPSQNNWDINRIQKVIESLFFKCTEHDKHNHNQDIIRAIELKMAIKGNAVADDAQIHAELLKHDGQDVVDLDIDDLFRDEFDSFDDAIRDLCDDMQISRRTVSSHNMQIPRRTVSSEWMQIFEAKDQTFIKLRDCVYASKHFAKGNAKCHLAWNPKTEKPMCIKLLSNTSQNDHERYMLEKLMQHTRQKPGQHNIVEYFGHEVRQSSICLKFEFVHSKNSFRKDLENMTDPEIVTYMRELLKALDSLHNKYGITHRDIKPDNFVHHFQTNTFRLVDFGSAVYESHDNGIGLKTAGTRGFKAPELLQPSHGLTTKGFRRQQGIDIWSAGIILMSLLTGQKDILSQNVDMATVDCNAKHLTEIGNIVGRNAMQNLNTKNLSNYGDGCKEGKKTGWAAKALQLCKRSRIPSDEALDLLSKMLMVCPRQRIRSDEALKHPWLNPQWLPDDDGADGFDNAANTTIEFSLDIGLPNNANWCYLNSVLQCLKHTTELTSAVIKEKTTYQLNTANRYCEVTQQLRKFLVSDTKANQDIALNYIRKRLLTLDNKFDGNTQQDAVEVCELLLQGMCRAYATQCPASDVMEYAIQAEMRCTGCGATRNPVPEHELIAKLAVPNSYCLQTAIDLWLAPEILHDVACPTCQSQTFGKTKQLVLAPSVFILQLKIFNSNGTKKVQPLRRNAGSTVKVGIHDYHIFAVVTHAGASLMNGHYMSYTEKNAVWVCFDDDNVMRNKHWQTDDGQQGNETPYIFFLRRIQGSAQAAVADQIACKQNDRGSKTVKSGGAVDEHFLSTLHATVSSDTSLYRNFVENSDSDEQPGFDILNRVDSQPHQSQDDATVSSDASQIRKFWESDVPDEEPDVDCMDADIFTDDDKLAGSKKERRGQDKEPNILQSILFSMQGDVNHGREPFGLDEYVNLWRLHIPSPKKQQITIASIPFETTNFGSSIRPFLHQATIDLLLMNNITEWLDIDANNSFVIHLALAMNKNPLALHTMFARNCTRKASQNCVWTSDVLDAVYPSSLNIEIVILVKQEGENTYTSKKYGSGETPESRVVLVKDGMDYSWLEDNRIRDVHIQQFQQNCRNENCVKWETLTKKSVFIRGCDNSKNEAPAHWKKTVWEAACNKVGLQSSETGKWLTKPSGCDLDLSLQDGSLTPQSFEQLHNVLLDKKITCGSVADLGSEAGHAVAQFAFKPFVNQVIGIEIQYAWLAYSVIIMQHLQAESCKDEYYLADIHILHGSFLDTTLMEWEAALSRADLCFCNNVNWEKGARARPVPQEQQSMKGEYRNSINANVAHLLVDIMKLNSHVLVFDAASFANQAFQRVQTLNLMATWSTLAQGTQVHLLKTYPTHFKVLKKALKTLCQAKNCNFESLPRDWWEHEVQKKRDTFLRLSDHVMNQDYFAKSNASVHWGWNVTVPMIVCIKKFPERWQHAQIQKEIVMLKEVANSDEASKHSVIRFFGTDIDRQGGTVLIFERVDASSLKSDLEDMTAQNIAEYMYRLLQALNYLHKQDVVHRDVKPDNFLHNFKSQTFRLIDFGSAERGTQGFVRKGGGTREFRAPEILIGEKKQTAAVDVWSAGIILLSLITGKPNILSRQEKQIKGNDCDAIHLKEIGCIVGNSEMREIGDTSDGYGGGIRHENNTGWAAKALQSAIPGRKLNNGDHALDLLSKMLKVQSSKRITTEDALKHPFLQSAVNRP